MTLPAEPAVRIPAGHPTYRPDIDGLRAVAVVSVILYHFGFRRFDGGYVGVDVFFVISGFLITGYILADLEAGTFTFSGFYVRRARRLFPALFVTLLCSFVAGVALLSPDHLAALSRSLVASVASVSNFVFWGEAGYFDTQAYFKPLLHTWSLSVEEQFYFIWPLTITLLWKAGRRVAIVWFLIVAGAVSLGAAEWVLREDREAAFYLVPFRICEFAIGALCVWLTRRGPVRARFADLLSVSGLAAIAWSALSFDSSTRFPGISALAPCLGTAAVVWTGDRSQVVRTLLGNRLAVGTGLISYSLYLVHWPLFVYYRYWTIGPLSRTQKLALVFLTFVLAYLMYRIVERPFRYAKGRKMARPLVFAGGAAACAVALMLPAFHAWRTVGWPWRVSEDVQRAVGDAEQAFERRRIAIRSPECHVGADFNERYKPRFARCVAMPDGRGNVLVIGDSHAADLWMALRYAYPETNFLQATGAGCLPASGPSRARHCGELLAYLKSEFEGLSRVDGVILAGRWGAGYTRLMDEIRFYRERRIPVAVFGPVMEFDPDVRTLTFRHGRTEGLDAFVHRHRVVGRATLDREMARYFAENGVNYVSTIGVFCADGSCPLLDRHGTLLIQDYGHWGVEAARHFGEQMVTRYPRIEGVFGLE